ncbi:MAG: antitoxin [Chloroflexi bacterium]|nr:antitoxin [Chloroflexota bacterium]
MINRYSAVAQRIRQERDELERIFAVVQRHWQMSKTATDADAYLNSVALNLHGFYSGLERIFELIAIDLDGIKLGGERWHIELLHQMTLDLPQVRPPVLSRETAERLDAYRKFRHLIRNIYTTHLDPGELEKLVVALPRLWMQTRDQLDALANYLDQLSHADEDKT